MITLPSQDGRKGIERISPKQASRILGVQISPDGPSRYQTRLLHQITASWSNKIRLGHINKQDTCYYFQTTVLKSLEFPLIATSMNEIQCHYIESPALCLALKVSGITYNMHRYIVATPLAYLWINNRTIYETQGLKHIMVLTKFGLIDPITEKNLESNYKIKN